MRGDDASDLKRVPSLLPGDVPSSDSQLPGSDSGIKEAKLLSRNLTSDEIANHAENLEHSRNQKFRDNFEKIALCGLWLFAAVIYGAGLSWFYHVVLPESVHWLNADSVARLQNILTGGIVAAVAGGHLKRRIG